MQKRAQQGQNHRRQVSWPDLRPEHQTIKGKEEEEENPEGNCKQTTKNPIRGIHGWEKESAARSRLERAGNLAGYATGLLKEPKEEEEEEYAARNRKQPARNPIGGNQGWENENEPTSAPSTLGIHGGAAGRFTKQATTLLEEGNKQNSGKKSKSTTQSADGRKGHVSR